MASRIPSSASCRREAHSTDRSTSCGARWHSRPRNARATFTGYRCWHASSLASLSKRHAASSTPSARILPSTIPIQTRDGACRHYATWTCGWAATPAFAVCVARGRWHAPAHRVRQRCEPRAGPRDRARTRGGRPGLHILGFAGATSLTRLLGTLLFGVGPRDPLTLGGSAAVLAAVALLACFVPPRVAQRGWIR